MAEAWNPAAFGLTPAPPPSAVQPTPAATWDPSSFGLTPASAQSAQSPPVPSTSDPSQRPSLGTRVDQYVRSLGQGMTFGFGDEIAAGADAATHALLGRGSDAGSFSDRYDANLASERAQDAAIPSAIAIPGQLIGGVAGIAAGAPEAALRLIPGGNALLGVAGTGGRVVTNALARIPGGATAATLGGAALEGAAYGGVQGFADGEGGFENRLDSARRGAETGAVLGPVIVGGVNAGRAVVGKVGQVLSEAGYGARNPLLDTNGAALTNAAGQPITATAGVADAAGKQLAAAASDPVATQAALQAPAELVSGSQPTTFQASGDTGLGQLELRLRNQPGTSQAFLDRANQQNLARVQAIGGTVPAEASSADTVSALTRQQADLQASQDAARAQAAHGTMQGVGGAADSTPTQAGASLRGAIDEARAPALNAADAAVQRVQGQATNALNALGGVPAGDAATAQQQIGQQFRSVLDNANQANKAQVSRLYSAIDPDGTLAVDMKPVQAAGAKIKGAIPNNAAPLSGEESAIFNTVANLPPVQSFKELSALNERVTTAMRAARSDPSQAQAYARLSQLRSGLADAMQGSVVNQAGQDAAAVQAGTMHPEDAMEARVRSAQTVARDDASGPDRTSVQRSASAPAAGQLGSDGAIASGATGPRGAGSDTGLATAPPAQVASAPLAANFDAEAAQRYADARSAHAERMATYGKNAPGVGAALAPGPTAGTFRMADSAVPSAIFSKGAGVAERVQAALQGGLTPSQIADYAAFDLRRTAQNADGTLNPAKADRWRQQNAEAFQALRQADSAIGRSFDTAQSASVRLDALRWQRAALDATHPLAPGWGDAETMQRVWQAGPKGADSVTAALNGAHGSPVAAQSVADYAAYTLRKMAAPDGVLNPAKYQQWLRTYDGALSARPDLKASFDTVAAAQSALDDSAAQHAQALKDFQASAAKHFLGGADPADRVGQLLNGQTRVGDMADLARLTENDPAARAGIQRAIVDNIYKRFQGNALAGDTGETKLKSDQFQTFISRSRAALEKVMTPQQVDTLQKVAADLQRANTSIDGVRAGGGSDTTQKASLAAQAEGSTMMSMLRAHGLTGLMTFAGEHFVGGAMGPLGGAAIGHMMSRLKSGGIAQTSDLVKEAMLNPGLARTLMANVTTDNAQNVGNAFVGQINKLAASRLAHATSGSQQNR